MVIVILVMVIFDEISIHSIFEILIPKTSRHCGNSMVIKSEIVIMSIFELKSMIIIILFFLSHAKIE